MLILLTVQLFNTGTDTRDLDEDNIFFEEYFDLNGIRQRTNNRTENNTTTIKTNKTNQSRELITLRDNAINMTKKKQRILSQNDVLSSEFEVPEFVCTRNDTKAAQIYCYGDILHVVMMLGLYKDSKTFVDKPLKNDPDEVVAAFRKRFSKTITEKDREAVEQFIDNHFSIAGDELDE